MSLSFPLPDNFFPKVKLNNQTICKWISLLKNVLQQAIIEEEEFYENDYKTIETKCWKHYKSENNLHTYIPTDGSPLHAKAINNHINVFSCAGTVLGKVDDFLLGLRTVNNAEAAVCAEFTKIWLDMKILAEIDIDHLPGQNENHYSTLQLKWRAVRTPAGKLIRARDVTILELVGTTTDLKGRPISFLIYYSVDVPEVPSFPPEYNVIRMQNKFVHIMRQLTEERMGTFSYSEPYMEGNLSLTLQRMTLIRVFFHLISGGLEFAAAKKLTILALSISPVLHPSKRIGSSEAEPILIVNQSLACGTCKQNKDGPLSSLKKMLSSCKIDICLVCGMFVCSSCSIQAQLISDNGLLLVNSCKSCVISARRMISGDFNNNYQTLNDAVNSPESDRTGIIKRRSSSSTPFFPFQTIKEFEWKEGVKQLHADTETFLRKLRHAPTKTDEFDMH